MTKTYVPQYFTEIYKEKLKKICLFIFVLNEGNRKGKCDNGNCDFP